MFYNVFVNITLYKCTFLSCFQTYIVAAKKFCSLPVAVKTVVWHFLFWLLQNPLQRKHTCGQ